MRSGTENIFGYFDDMGNDVSENISFKPDRLTEQLLTLNGSLENYTDQNGIEHILIRKDFEIPAELNDTWERVSFPGEIFPLDALCPDEI